MAAYSQRTLSRKDDGTWEAAGNIAQWKGSLDDLAKAAVVVTSESPDATFTATVTLADGKSAAFSTAENLSAAATEIAPESIETIRIEVADPDTLEATLVVRDRWPAMLI